MNVINRILCPVDFSEHSRRALEQAVVLARQYDATLRVLHVFTTPSAMAAVAGDGSFVPVENPAVSASYRADREVELSCFVAAVVPADVTVSREVAEGPAAAIILQTAAALPADLIVMGTHGRSGVRRFLVGSVTEHVLRRSSCPVLTVPPRSPAPVVRPRRILCPIDFSRASNRALAFAVSVARESSAELIVLHAIDVHPDAFRRGLIDLPAYRATALNSGREELEQTVRRFTGGYTNIRESVVFGKPSTEILRLAAEEDVDLIFMGLHGRTSADLFFFGSTTQHVVREAACPVVTIGVQESARSRRELTNQEQVISA